MARLSQKVFGRTPEGDEIIHDIFTRLNQTFITPLDPEDIHSLSSRLDDVLDGIEDADSGSLTLAINATLNGIGDVNEQIGEQQDDGIVLLIVQPRRFVHEAVMHQLLGDAHHRAGPPGVYSQTCPGQPE